MLNKYKISEYCDVMVNGDASLVCHVGNGSVLKIPTECWRVISQYLGEHSIIMLLQKKAKQSLEENADIGRESTLSFIAAIKEYTSHLFEIVMLKKHDYFYDSFENKLVRQKKYEKKITMLEAKNDTIIEFFIMLSTVVIIAFGGYEVCKGRITIGALMLYVQYYSGLLSPFGVILQNIFDYVSVRPSLKKIIDYLHVEDVAT